MCVYVCVGMGVCVCVYIYIYILYCLLSVVLNNYVIKQIAVKSIHKLILFIEQNKDRKICDAISSNSHVKNGSRMCFLNRKCNMMCSLNYE